MKALSRTALRRPVSTLMFFAALTLLGMIAFVQIPVSLMPRTAFPGLTIEVSYSGVGPERIEEVNPRRREDTVTTVGGLEGLTNTTEGGRSRNALG